MKMSEEISSSDNSTNSTIVTTQAIIEVDNVITKRKDNNIEVQPTHEMAMHSNPMLSTTTITTVVKEDIDKQINESVSSPQLVLAGSAGPSTSAIQCLKNMNEIVAQPSGSKQKIHSDSVEGGERNCWICFATDEDNSLAAWVQPCKCRGSTKWVHQSCLYRWVDEKQKGNALRAVSCQQCQTEYIIVFPHMGRVANVLEAFDNLIKRVSPFLAAGVFVGSLYWTAVTYGAVTFLQIVGHKKGLALMENGDPLILLIGLPAIPVALVLGRMIRWEDAVIRLIRNRRSVARKFPLMSFIIPYSDEDEEHQSAQNPITPTLSDPVSATRIFCGALLLPTISSIVGRLLFESIENTLHRTLLGGLTFITMKGILKIYLKQQQYTRRKKRRIVDYTEDNIRVYGGGGGGSGGGNGGARNSATRSSHNAHNNNSGNGNGNNNRAHINATGNVSGSGSGSGSGDGYANGNRNSPAIDVVLQIPLQTNQQQQQQQMYTERSGRRHSIQQHVLRSNSLRDSLV